MSVLTFSINGDHDCDNTRPGILEVSSFKIFTGYVFLYASLYTGLAVVPTVVFSTFDPLLLIYSSILRRAILVKFYSVARKLKRIRGRLEGIKSSIS